jgi:hypothetical protein
MARMTVSSAKARRYVRIAQMAGLALGVSAAALWALEVPGLRGQLPGKPPVDVVPVVSRPSQASGQPVIDSDGVDALAERLNEAAKRPAAPVAQGDKPVETPRPAPTAWRYIAPLKMGKQLAAIVFADGKQRVLRPGAKVADTTLISVDERKLVIEDPTGRHDILRGEKNGSHVLWKKMDSNAPALAGAGAGAGDANLSPEELAKRGIDGSQAQRFREAMRDRSRRRAEMAAQGTGGSIPSDRPGAAGLPDAAMAVPLDKDAQMMRENPKLQSLADELERHLRTRGMDSEAQELINKLQANGYPPDRLDEQIRRFKESKGGQGGEIH